MEPPYHSLGLHIGFCPEMVHNYDVHRMEHCTGPTDFQCTAKLVFPHLHQFYCQRPLQCEVHDPTCMKHNLVEMVALWYEQYLLAILHFWKVLLNLLWNLLLLALQSSGASWMSPCIPYSRCRPFLMSTHLRSGKTAAPHPLWFFHSRSYLTRSLFFSLYFPPFSNFPPLRFLPTFILNPNIIPHTSYIHCEYHIIYDLSRVVMFHSLSTTIPLYWSPYLILYTNATAVPVFTEITISMETVLQFCNDSDIIQWRLLFVIGTSERPIVVSNCLQ
jgi:hypothetical protein